MTLLNQVIAVVNGKKTRTQEGLAEVYKLIQKPELFNGLARRYKPLNDDDTETFPPENKPVQANASDCLNKAEELWTELFDVVYTQESANCHAVANIELNGEVVAKDVPVSYLLFLEKQLVDVRTFVSKLPTLDPTVQWQFDANANTNVGAPYITNKTRKVMKNHVKAVATDKHPAQVDTFTEDVKVGEWTNTQYSTAISGQEKQVMLDRVNDLLDAVKVARETANSTVVQNRKIGKQLFAFLFK